MGPQPSLASHSSLIGQPQVPLEEEQHPRLSSGLSVYAHIPADICAFTHTNEHTT